ncbi:hypothetical protein [Stenotrophomonas maltophilia]|uniref:hypothetical protein n=1 Tax=Stenotrophomonas maltophilia TaxID=40324 RepID=UPI001140C821|nr:hypothetical protein [Stenotrophomonas maltophilia]
MAVMPPPKVHTPPLSKLGKGRPIVLRTVKLSRGKLLLPSMTTPLWTPVTVLSISSACEPSQFSVGERPRNKARSKSTVLVMELLMILALDAIRELALEDGYAVL